MSYLALARKWRPRRFEDVMGQSHVVKALTHALDHDRLHPAILLTGTRGVGKTTLARILAKGLNCQRAGVSSQPCGQCDTCLAVDAGRFVDLLEIDAASNTGVDNVRELIDNSQYPPVLGRYKVYLIDEVHMLSKAAFNALLKTLEEPPAHVKFVLATTDPQKLLVTVLSRCLQFNLKRLPVTVIRSQLARILEQEGLSADSAALGELARAADGSMRDGLSLLDQAIAFAGGESLSQSLVEDMLGSVGRQRVYALIQAIAAGDSAGLLALLQAIDAQSPDFAALLDELGGCLQRIALLQLLPDAQSEDDDEALLELLPSMSPEAVQLYYQIGVNGRRDLPWAPDPRIGFEMTLLRMFAFRPDDGLPGGSTPAGGSAVTERDGSASRAPQRAATPSAPTAAPTSATTAAATATPGATPASVPAVAVAAPSAAPATTTAAPTANFDWERWLEQAELDGATRNAARQCALVGLDAGGVLTLDICAEQAFLWSDERRQTLIDELSRSLRRDCRIQLRSQDVAADTLDSPAQRALLRASERQRAAEAEIQADPVVQAMMQTFGARLRPGSIHPLNH